MAKHSIQLVASTLIGFILLTSLAVPLAQATSFPVTVPLKSHQKLAGIHWQLAEFALNNGDTAGAIAELESATALLPKNNAWKQELVALYEKTGLYYPAIKLLNDLSVSSPKQASYWYQRGLLFEKLNQLELATESLQKATQLDPTQGAYFYDLGVYASRLGLHQVSANASLKAIDLNFNKADAYNNYGYALSHTGNYALAEKAINEALKLQPHALAATMDSKGYLCHQQNRCKEALIWYNRALEKDPLLSEVHLHKAETFEALGQFPEAIAGYQTYLKLTKPNDELAAIVQHLRQLKEKLANKSNRAQTSPVSLNP